MEKELLWQSFLFIWTPNQVGHDGGRAGHDDAPASIDLSAVGSSDGIITTLDDEPSEGVGYGIRPFRCMFVRDQKIKSGQRVAVKARETFEGVTSLSCLEVSGEMHTFLVAYSERVERLEMDMRESAVTPGLPGSLSYVSPDSTFSSRSLSDYAAMKQELYHLGTREYGIELRCENIFVKEDVLYLVFSLRNDSAVSYEMSTPRFAVESARRSRRGLQYEKAVLPRSAYGMGTVAPGSESRMVFAFDKLALVKGQVFRVYFYEKGGARNLRVTMSGRDVNGARRL